MVNEILRSSKHIVPAIGNAKARFAKGAGSAVQFWAITPDGQVLGVGIFGGEMRILNNADELNDMPKFVDFDDDFDDVIEE